MPLNPASPSGPEPSNSGSTIEWGTIIVAVIGLSLVVLLISSWHQLNVYRQNHGRVTAVSASTWAQEVTAVKDRRPVLILFTSAGTPASQHQTVARFAWENAGRVKVVTVDLNSVANMPLASQYNVNADPTIVVFYRTGSVTKAGAASRNDLLELVQKARRQGRNAKPLLLMHRHLPSKDSGGASY